MKLINKKYLKLRKKFSGLTFNRLATALFVITTFMFLSACADSASKKAEEVGGVTAKQIIENPAAYNGKTVTVSGDVEEIHSPRSFNMDSGLSVGELLVVGREPFPQLPDAGDRAYVINDVATVTGVVRMLDAKGLKDEIGWDLDPNLLSEYNGKPVLVAQKTGFRAGKGDAAVTTANPNADRTDATNDRMNDGKMTTESNNGSMTTDDKNGKMTSGDRITDAGIWGSTADKTSLVGKNAEFSNLRVVRVVGPRTFTVDSGKGEIYVMLDDGSARQVGTQGKVDVGDTVNLTGEFQRLNMEEIKDTANDRFRPLTDTEREFMKKTPVYFNVNKISKLK